MLNISVCFACGIRCTTCVVKNSIKIISSSKVSILILFLISSVKVNIYVSGEDGGHDVKGSNKTITYGQTGDFSDASGHGYHFRVISWSS